MDEAKPTESVEVGLIDQFIEMHVGAYELKEEVYATLLQKLLMNRVNNAAWQYDQASG